MLAVVEPFLELGDALTNASHELRDLATTKQHEDDNKDDEQFLSAKSKHDISVYVRRDG